MPVSARHRTSRYPQGIAKATEGPPLTGEPDLEVLVCWGALHPCPGHCPAAPAPHKHGAAQLCVEAA